MIDELLLLSGNDIPFEEARLTIHPPRIKEIAYITEQRFWAGCQLLKFDKEILPDEDKVNLSNKTNFDIIMTMIQEKALESQQARLNIMSILALLFPTKHILLNRKTICIQDPQTKEVGEINNDNFETFKTILTKVFCLSNDENKQYDPSGELAKKIANKIKQGHAKKAELAPEQKVAILSRYISILAVGQQKDMNELLDYTVYQLMDEFRRYELKLHYDAWERYRIAGATGMEDPEDWLKDIHEN